MHAVVWFELNKDLCLSFFKGKQRIVAEEKLFPDPPLTPKKIIEHLRGGGMGGYAGRNVSSKLFHHIWDELWGLTDRYKLMDLELRDLRIDV
jgi:hypothetical protein